MYSAQKHLDVCYKSIYNLCNKINKSALSKKDNNYYKFEYIKESDLPDNHIKSKNIRPRKVSDEDKKKHKLERLNKRSECPNCKKMITYNNSFKHRKTCNKQQ